MEQYQNQITEILNLCKTLDIKTNIQKLTEPTEILNEISRILTLINESH
jgi:hypothetical protein